MKIDGVEMKSGDRMLVDKQGRLIARTHNLHWWNFRIKKQLKQSAYQNGLYVITTGEWVNKNASK